MTSAQRTVVLLAATMTGLGSLWFLWENSRVAPQESLSNGLWLLGLLGVVWSVTLVLLVTMPGQKLQPVAAKDLAAEPQRLQNT